MKTVVFHILPLFIGIMLIMKYQQYACIFFFFTCKNESKLKKISGMHTKNNFHLCGKSHGQDFSRDSPLSLVTGVCYHTPAKQST